MAIANNKSNDSGPLEIRSQHTLSAETHKISENIIVHKGGKLTIEAGAVLRFNRNAGIIVLGTLKACGTSDREITLTGNPKWGGLLFHGEKTGKSQVEFVKINNGFGRCWTGKLGSDDVPELQKVGRIGDSSGGAVSVFDTGKNALSFSNVTFTGNSCNLQGGAVIVTNSAANFTSCKFEGNDSGIGGAIFCKTSTIQISKCEFLDNENTNDKKPGGALLLSDSVATIDSSTFKGHKAFSGGAISSTNTSLTLTDCEFIDNSSTDKGGGVFASSDAPPEIKECKFRGNTAEDSGGALYVSINPQNSLELDHCTFESNKAEQTGGAFTCEKGNSVSLTECSFTGNCGFKSNRSLLGGAVFCPDRSRFTFHLCRFDGNEAKMGGAISLGSADIEESSDIATAAITCSSLKSNSVEQAGGAIYVATGNTFEIKDKCKFNDNQAATFGGAIAVAPAGSILLINAELKWNSSGNGGAVHWRGNHGQIQSCSFENNQGNDSGGAIECLAPLTVKDCVFKRNKSRNVGGGAVWTTTGKIDLSKCNFIDNSTLGSSEGGAIGSSEDNGSLQDKNRFTDNKPNNVAYKLARYPEGSGDDEAKSKKKCWIVTAYYGHPDHPSVNLIRAYRSDLLARPRSGRVIEIINRFYFTVGDSRFGQWWCSQLSVKSRIPHLITGVLCRLLHFLAR